MTLLIMLGHLSGLIIHLIGTLGYSAVFLLMMLESCLIPIPSEITLPFAGFLSQSGTFNLLLVILFGVLGDIAGTMIAYALGFFLEEKLIVGLIKKYGKFILISTYEYDHVMHWFQKKGYIFITISKLLPGFRTIIGLPAGLAETPWHKVLLYSAVGSVIWCAIFTYVGFVLGKNWDSLHPIFQKFEFVIVGIALTAILWYINHKLHIIKFKK